jgi:hypothetical protein
MTKHHHPESRRDEPATPRQQRALRALAQQTGQTFVVPKTKGQASDQIDRLKRAKASTRVERRLEDRYVSRELATGSARSARIREDETTTTGYGATARWA